MSAEWGSANVGQESCKLSAADAAADNRFGWSVALDDDHILVGAPAQDVEMERSGAAYLFDAATGRQIAKITASDAEALDDFARSVAISGGSALIGAPRNEDAGDFTGSAYVYSTVPEPTSAALLALCVASYCVVRKGRIRPSSAPLA